MTSSGLDQPLGANIQPMLIQIRVKPGARTSALQQAADGTWLAQLKSLPVDGKANAELITLVARTFGCSKSSVAIKSGASARTKLIRIDAA